MPNDEWQISSYCQAGNSCVGLRRAGDRVQLRESDQPGEIITTTPEKLRDFIRGVKSGEFDHVI
ncbi:DUF397 domain-containing protein [Streptomyces pactum]|uniref:DUF397 domain-containing protein n=1 Tax=Streptomyces pactum TaxID=68249 RepID=UPI0036F4D804